MRASECFLGFWFFFLRNFLKLGHLNLFSYTLNKYSRDAVRLSTCAREALFRACQKLINLHIWILQKLFVYLFV
jgi:hypothetical protein